VLGNGFDGLTADGLMMAFMFYLLRQAPAFDLQEEKII
jgi:hypothetical protein